MRNHRARLGERPPPDGDLVALCRRVATTHGNPSSPEKYERAESKSRLLLLAVAEIELLRAESRILVRSLRAGYSLYERATQEIARLRKMDAP